MWQRMNYWLNDLCTTNPIERRQIYLLQILMLALIIIAPLGLPITLSTSGPDIMRALLITANLLVPASAVGALLLVRNHRFKLAMIVAIGGLNLCLLIVIAVLGLRSGGPMFLTLAMPLALAALLLGRRALFIVAGLTSIAIIATAWLERLSPPLAGFVVTSDIALDNMVITFCLVLLLVTLFLDSFSLALRAALNDLQQTNARLQHELVERQRIAEQLRVSETSFRLLFASNPQPMWVYDEQTLAFLEVNAAAAAHYGYSRAEFLALHTPAIVALNETTAPDSNKQALLQFGLEAKHRCKDGRIIDVEMVSHGLEFAGRRARLVVIQDVTERKKLQFQLMQAQKMDSIGRLAGGVAHDFNNLLTAMVSYAELSMEALPADNAARDDIAEILKAANRAAGLTRQLLAFARKQILEPQIFDLNALILDMDRLLRRVIGEDIELVTLPAADLGAIRADPGQIEQVILNLVVNARDAMPTGGRLTIETQNIILDDDYVQQHIGAVDGAFVMLAISDTGIGMDEEVRRRAFEPFFTTKEPGRGVGLGLATCYGIVKQHGGNIWLYSEPGQGTTLKVYLPRVDASPLEIPRYTEALPAACGSETILVVEDQAAVRALAVRVLQQHGYTVLEAGNGEEALQVVQEQADRVIDLVLSDVVMPRMGGKALVDRLIALRPAIKVLYISGYTDNAIIHHGQLDAGVALLQKPFSPSALARKVREVLDS